MFNKIVLLLWILWDRTVTVLNRQLQDPSVADSSTISRLVLTNFVNRCEKYADFYSYRPGVSFRYCSVLYLKTNKVYPNIGPEPVYSIGKVYESCRKIWPLTEDVTVAFSVCVYLFNGKCNKNVCFVPLQLYLRQNLFHQI